MRYIVKLGAGTNLGMQEQLYHLRTETKEAYDDAKSQEARFREIEKEQRELYQVCLSICTSLILTCSRIA